jgi:hypothetical protein
VATGDLRKFWVAEDDASEVSNADVEDYLRQ